MSNKCDGCGKFSDTLKSVTVAIHYSMGPMHANLCSVCRDSENTGSTLRGQGDYVARF